MDKEALARQLMERLRETVDVAEREMSAAAAHARDGATAAEKREDARTAIEFSGLARGQQQRAQQARFELSMIESFHPEAHMAGRPIGLGALVEIEEEEGELGGRTFFLAPAGAGIELTMPGGDGFLSVVTPSSPIGRAAMGCRLGDTVEVTVDGETRWWEITWVV